VPRLVVVSGPPNSGKLARAWEIAAADPELRFLHRDQVRVLFGRLIREDHLTLMLDAMAGCLLSQGYGVVTAGQNQAAADRALWHYTAMRTGATLEWVDTASSR
jgi:predicted kinase